MGSANPEAGVIRLLPAASVKQVGSRLLSVSMSDSPVDVLPMAVCVWSRSGQSLKVTRG